MILSVCVDLKTKEIRIMAKQYKGSLSLEWYNKQKAILLRGEEDIKLEGDIPAPKINWINKDEALFYEVDEKESKGLTPFWVDRTDIRVKEARPLLLQKVYRAIEKNKKWSIEESTVEDPTIENIIIKGDNLLALNTLKKMFDNKPEEEKVKCIYIDPPYNTGSAFEHYDDNLAHSEWLTLMRDRLIIIKELLRNDGFIFLHLDDKESSYCKVLMDEIFGRENYCNEIILTTNKPFGFKGTADSLFKQANHILLYAKNKSEIELKKIYIERNYDTAYNKVFLDTTKPEDEWEWEGINEHVAKLKGYENSRIAKKEIGIESFEFEVSQFALSNAERVFQAVGVSGGAYLKRVETIKKSTKIPNKIVRHPNDDMDYQFIGGRRVVYYKERLVKIDENILPGELITDTWTDISFEGLAHEGGVDFPKSKKPEKLMERVFQIGSDKGDLILDCFGGSGSTFAVAHKMNRKWIGIEIGEHANTHIVPRLKSILNGSDKSGISKAVNWQGGGAFKYYHVGESIIKVNEDGSGDFNWNLGRSYLEEAFLSSYDYTLDTSLDLKPGFIFGDNQIPLIGTQQVGTKTRVAIVSLNTPGEDNSFMTYDEIFYLYQQIKKHFNPQYINVFTNRGVEIAYESKPEDLEVIKIPQAIFAELES